MPPTTSAAERPAEPGQPAADGEGDGEDAVDVDPEPVGDPRVVDRRAQLRAEARPDEKELEGGGDEAADDHDEQAIPADARRHGMRGCPRATPAD